MQGFCLSTRGTFILGLRVPSPDAALWIASFFWCVLLHAARGAKDGRMEWGMKAIDHGRNGKGGGECVCVTGGCSPAALSLTLSLCGLLFCEGPKIRVNKFLNVCQKLAVCCCLLPPCPLFFVEVLSWCLLWPDLMFFLIRSNSWFSGLHAVWIKRRSHVPSGNCL